MVTWPHGIVSVPTKHSMSTHTQQYDLLKQVKTTATTTRWRMIRIVLIRARARAMITCRAINYGVHWWLILQNGSESGSMTLANQTHVSVTN